MYKKTLLPSFLTASGTPNVSNIQEIDQNHNTYISAYELRALILGIQIGEVGLESDYVEKAMEDFDLSGQKHRRFLSSKSKDALEGQQKQVAKKKKTSLHSSPPMFLVPFAINYGQALQAITSARVKSENAISLTLSETYNGVFMNNVMGLTMFLGLVYIRDLSWDVSAAVLAVVIICTVMGLYTSYSRKFPF
ncbi:hypothetical protein M0R45_013330 [Rubus argutus]|uniref:Uncharacterized protein n=1 Tax=Rubus argutus TaxID=59490 RepID=A0AAW1XJD8_RUBAR